MDNKKENIETKQQMNTQADQKTETSDKTEKAESAVKENKKEAENNINELKAVKKELAETKESLLNAKKELSEAADKYLRMLAEYDNYRRRTAEEKDSIYSGACTDILKEILPVLDNLERAIQFGSDNQKVMDGVKMTLTLFKGALEKVGVTEIDAKTFDPLMHNAVLHIEDENLGEGEIVEIMQKGYKKGDKVIRYAMVKVAN